MKININPFAIRYSVTRLMTRVISTTDTTADVYYEIYVVKQEEVMTDEGPEMQEREIMVENGNKTVPIEALALLAPPLNVAGLNQILSAFVDADGVPMSVNENAL